MNSKVTLMITLVAITGMIAVPTASAEGPVPEAGYDDETCTGGVYVQYQDLTVCTGDYCSGNCTGGGSGGTRFY